MTVYRRMWSGDMDIEENVLVARLIKKGEKLVVDFSGYKVYDGRPGVWYIIGFKKKIGKILEVAQTGNLFTEINRDINYMINGQMQTNLKKRYTARRLFSFNENFDVCECDKGRTQAKYRTIASNYDEIRIFVLSADNSDKAIREDIEMRFAIDNNVLYWNAFGRQRKKLNSIIVKIERR